MNDEEIKKVAKAICDMIFREATYAISVVFVVWLLGDYLGLWH